MKFLLTCVTTLFLITTYCLADVFDAIEEINSNRACKYNAPLAPAIDKSDPLDLSKLAIESKRIDKLLTKNVNTKVHATKKQQKKALQAVFATEVIYGVARPSYLDGIDETNAIYGHCYVLEYSALLARDFISSGSDRVDVNTLDYKKLCSYSGLDSNTLYKWFVEMRDKHMQGTQVHQERVKDLILESDSLNHNWTATYTLKDGKSIVIHTPTNVQIDEM